MSALTQGCQGPDVALSLTLMLEQSRVVRLSAGAPALQLWGASAPSCLAPLACSWQRFMACPEASTMGRSTR